MARQAEALGIEHVILETPEPYRENYIAGIRKLRDHYGIRKLVTGDIDLVDGLPNWPRECCEGTGVEVLTPLWGRDRLEILKQMVDEGFKIVFTLVKSPWLTPDWLGREITPDVLDELQALSRTNGIDPCGENGEFHTMALFGPQFRHEVRLDEWKAATQDEMAYMETVPSVEE
jgi:uncharacterized protein (TIGR00290 family)